MEKKDRIRVIFPDYLDGSREISSKKQRGLINYFGEEIYRYVNRIKISPDSLVIPAELISIKESVIEQLHEKTGVTGGIADLFRCMTRAIKHYTMAPNDNRNFILSKPLMKAFMDTTIDVKVETLPKEFSGYIDTNCFKTVYYDGDDSVCDAQAVGSYVSIFSGRLTIVSIFIVGDIYVPYYHSYDLTTGNKVSDIIECHPRNLGTTHYSIQNVNAMLNAVLYITHAPNDLMKYLYEFPRSEKKAARLKPHYTEKPVTIVGKFFRLPNKYKDDWIQNKGYFGWRWTGVGRSTLKYVWVRPSKPYKKGN